jgi:hypothetical protein
MGEVEEHLYIKLQPVLTLSSPQVVEVVGEVAEVMQVMARQALLEILLMEPVMLEVLVAMEVIQQQAAAGAALALGG